MERKRGRLSEARSASDTERKPTCRVGPPRRKVKVAGGGLRTQGPRVERAARSRDERSRLVWSGGCDERGGKRGEVTSGR